MLELIRIAKKQIGNETRECVNGKDLHGALKVATPYRIWVARRIEEADLFESVDFIGK